jgi:hypothetical protein
MNLERVRKAVELAAAQPGGIDYQMELDELLELEERIRKEEDDAYVGCIQFVDTMAMLDLMNMSTYDDYGKLAKAHGRDATFDEYATEVRKWHPTLTDENLHCGYDYVKDLWSDNEATGSNNEDGTFNKEV